MNVASAPFTQITKKKNTQYSEDKETQSGGEKHNTVSRNDRTKYTEANID